MALTVFLVRVLNPDGNSDTAAIFIASAYYAEKVTLDRCTDCCVPAACCRVLALLTVLQFRLSSELIV
jgi:hypothetical protein